MKIDIYSKRSWTYWSTMWWGWKKQGWFCWWTFWKAARPWSADIFWGKSLNTLWWLNEIIQLTMVTQCSDFLSLSDPWSMPISTHKWHSREYSFTITILSIRVSLAGIAFYEHLLFSKFLLISVENNRTDRFWIRHSHSATTNSKSFNSRLNGGTQRKAIFTIFLLVNALNWLKWLFSLNRITSQGIILVYYDKG